MFSFFALDSLPFLFPAELLLWNCGSGRDEEPSGEEAVLRQIRIRLATLSLQKSTPVGQDNWYHPIPE